MRQIEAILELTPLGRQALELIERYGIEVLFENDPEFDGTFDPNRDIITLNEDLDPATLAYMLVHEAAHAEWWWTGNGLDATEVTREELVANHLENELQAQLEHIRFNQELQAIDPSVPDAVTQGFYERAYEAAVAAMEAQHGPLTEAERQQIGEQAGADAIMHAMEQGGPDGGGYLEAAEEHWDDANSSWWEFW